MWRIIKIWRSVDVVFQNPDPNRYSREYSKEHWLLHPTIELEDGFYIRKNDAPYDDSEEHWMLMSDWSGYLHTSQIAMLQSLWYFVFFNEKSHQSQKSIWHGHIIKIKNLEIT